jgi:hypothetical protein
MLSYVHFNQWIDSSLEKRILQKTVYIVWILGELFYICSLKYPYLLNDSHISLWRQITGLMSETIENNDDNTTTIIDKPTVPVLLSDPVVLLLRIMLNLPYPITRGTFTYVFEIHYFIVLESYRVIVQALFNLTYIQSLFTVISEMNKTEQEIWSTIPTNKSENVGFDFYLKNMANYVRIISFKLFQANFYSDTDNVCAY